MTSAVHLFKPDEAVRSFRPAVIDYYLRKPAQKLTLDILDNSGNVVRSYTASAADDKKKKTEEEEDLDFGPPRTPPPGLKAGTNRFNWDLRYSGATVFDGEVLWGARAQSGPMAVPGTYQVRLTADGVTQTQPIEVKLDPREHTSQAELQQQFDLSIKIRDQVSACDEMVIAIRKLKKEAKEREDQSKDEKVVEAGASLRDKLSTIEEEIYQIKNRANEDPLNFPIKLNNQIAALARTVETGDNPPTDQDMEVFQLLTGRLATIQAKYDKAMKVDLEPFNELLNSKKLTPIAAK
jgi:hypothetical protein